MGYCYFYVRMMVHYHRNSLGKINPICSPKIIGKESWRTRCSVLRPFPFTMIKTSVRWFCSKTWPYFYSISALWWQAPAAVGGEALQAMEQPQRCQGVLLNLQQHCQELLMWENTFVNFKIQDFFLQVMKRFKQKMAAGAKTAEVTLYIWVPFAPFFSALTMNFSVGVIAFDETYK